MNWAPRDWAQYPEELQDINQVLPAPVFFAFRKRPGKALPGRKGSEYLDLGCPRGQLLIFLAGTSETHIFRALTLKRYPSGDPTPAELDALRREFETEWTVRRLRAPAAKVADLRGRKDLVDGISQLHAAVHERDTTNAAFMLVRHKVFHLKQHMILMSDSKWPTDDLFWLAIRWEVLRPPRNPTTKDARALPTVKISKVKTTVPTDTILLEKHRRVRPTRWPVLGRPIRWFKAAGARARAILGFVGIGTILTIVTFVERAT